MNIGFSKIVLLDSFCEETLSEERYLVFLHFQLVIALEGAPPHFAIARVNFLVWGYLRDKIYMNRSDYLDDLNQRIC